MTISWNTIITIAVLARKTGIIQRQLGYCAMGHRNLRKNQREKIIKDIRENGKELFYDKSNGKGEEIGLE